MTAGLPGSRRVLSLAVLGDSVAAGMGDPVAGGRWRGFAPLLADAVEAARFTNLASSGARVAEVWHTQLPAALRAEPDAAVVMVGMNDTMRSDFDPRLLWQQLNHVVCSLVGAGAAVVTIRYHDHARVFRLPGPLRRLLNRRIDALNRILTSVAETHGAAIVDLDRLPGAYHHAAWSVDRLHPSELGHRMLAAAFAAGLAGQGLAVPSEVSLSCSGGVPVTRLDHVRWLLIKGVPWLASRTRDLTRYSLASLLRAVFRRSGRADVAGAPAHICPPADPPRVWPAG